MTRARSPRHPSTKSSHMGNARRRPASEDSEQVLGLADGISARSDEHRNQKCGHRRWHTGMTRSIPHLMFLPTHPS